MLRLVPVPSRMLCSVSALLVAAAAPAALAQQPRIAVAGEHGLNAMHNGSLPISDLAVSEIVARNFPEALHGDQSYHITLVVDANGKYVSGKAVKVTIIARSAGDSAGLVMGDSAMPGAIGAARVMMRKVQDGELPAAGAMGGLPGTAYKLSDVSAMGMKRYAAGELGDALLMVTAVQLKE